MDRRGRADNSNLLQPRFRNGTQFTPDAYEGVTAQIAFHDGAALLGSFTENGTANGDADNSAIFLGVVVDSTGADITSAVLSLAAAPGTGTSQFGAARNVMGPEWEERGSLVASSRSRSCSRSEHALIAAPPVENRSAAAKKAKPVLRAAVWSNLQSNARFATTI